MGAELYFAAEAEERAADAEVVPAFRRAHCTLCGRFVPDGCVNIVRDEWNGDYDDLTQCVEGKGCQVQDPLDTKEKTGVE